MANDPATNFEKGQPLSELTDKKLKEASGLAASVGNPNMLWTHNDSGNDPEIFLVDRNLEIKLTVRLAGVENRDWEDITVGPGPDPSKNYVYVGDIGDNDSVYPEKYIYRFPEPTLGSDDQISVSAFDKIVFRLEDGVKDTESLFIDASSKNLYVISKREEPVFVYELKYPQPTGDVLTARKIGSLPFKGIVAADRFSKGDIIMKNYTHIFYWENKEREDVATLLKRPPLEVPYEAEPQGESIAWAVNGTGFYTLSEKKKKQPSYLYFYSRR
jgi:hypothetical protein